MSPNTCYRSLRSIHGERLGIYTSREEGFHKGLLMKVLFLCTGNSCRSQMAEGWAHHLKSDLIEPYSAGLETHGLNPNAVKVMQEAGVDISGQQSTHVKEYKEMTFDHVVTVCGHAHENCPVFIGSAKVIHTF